MEKMFSLKIEKKFLIHGRGLILIPVLKMPRLTGFKPFKDEIIVLKPDGEMIKLSAEFHVEHLHMIEGMSQYKIVILLPNKTRSDIPDGSEIGLTEEVFSRLEFSTKLS